MGRMSETRALFVAFGARKQEQQRNHIAELQKTSNVQEQKLASLKQQVIELKAKIKTRIKAAPVKMPAQKKVEVYDSAAGTSSIKVLPPRDPEISQSTATKQVHSNGKVSFNREQPFLQELAEELGRPRHKPAPAPVRYPQRSGNRHHSCNNNSKIESSHSGGKWDNWKNNWKNHGQDEFTGGAVGSLQISGPSAGPMTPAAPGSGEATRNSTEFCTRESQGLVTVTRQL